MTLLLLITWYSVYVEMLLQEVMVFLGVTYAMKYCISVAHHPQVLEPCHDAKPPTSSLDIGWIAHGLISRVGNQTKVFKNTLRKKNAEYFLIHCHYA